MYIFTIENCSLLLVIYCIFFYKQFTANCFYKKLTARYKNMHIFQLTGFCNVIIELFKGLYPVASQKNVIFPEFFQEGFYFGDPS